MDRAMLRDDQSERIEQLLPGTATDRGVKAKDKRRFVQVVPWIRRTGSTWRDLPSSRPSLRRTGKRLSRRVPIGVRRVPLLGKPTPVAV